MNGPVCFDVVVRGMGGSSGVLGEGGNEATEQTRGEPGWAPGQSPAGATSGLWPLASPCPARRPSDLASLALLSAWSSPRASGSRQQRWPRIAPASWFGRRTGN